MIVIDTSALIAILLGEPEGRRCIDALAQADAVLISAGTLAEALIVSERRACRPAMEDLLGRIDAEVVALGPAESARVADAHAIWGKGVHAAGLNFGDCFAYALAAGRRAPLLFVGDDFSRTDAVAA